MATAPVKSAAVAQRNEKFTSLSTLLQSGGMKHKLKLALPKHLDPDRMIRIALSAASRQPLLLQCSQESVALSLLRAAEFGVEPDGWDAHLVPYKNKGQLECQLIVDYKGLAKMAYQSELVLEIQAGAVYEGDTFEYAFGSESYLRHIPTNDEPGPLLFAWALAKIKGGGAPFVVLNRRQVMDHKKASQSASSEYSPWVKYEGSMWKKTAVRELAKLIPRSSTLHKAIAYDAAIDAGLEIVDGVVVPPAIDEAPSKSEDTAGKLNEKLPPVETTREPGDEPQATEAGGGGTGTLFNDEGLIDDVVKKLASAGSVNDVGSIEKWAIGGPDDKPLPQAIKDEIRAKCDARKAEIRKASGK